MDKNKRGGSGTGKTLQSDDLKRSHLPVSFSFYRRGSMEKKDVAIDISKLKPLQTEKHVAYIKMWASGEEE